MTKPLKQYIIERWPDRFKKTGLNQRQFAAYSKLSPAAWSEILNEKRKRLHQTTIDRIEQAFKKLGV